jgi:hypothetical protein
MELTQEQSMTFDFLSHECNQLTREGNTEKWRNNVMSNRKHFCKGNPDITGLTAYVVCAGPSLEKNVHQLKEVSERGVIVAVDASLRYMTGQGVTPEYCIIIDGSEKMLKMIEGVDTSKITLVCTPSASPAALDEWKGPKFFVSTPFMYKDKVHNHFHLTRIVKAKKDLQAGQELMLDEEYEVEFPGIDTVISTGGNVSTSAHYFAMNLLKAQQTVFVGLDLSWTFDTHHYAGHEHMENTVDRSRNNGTHLDWNGQQVYTNFALLNFKRWHEEIAKQMPGSVVNATEGGILGIGQKGERLDYVEFLTLEEAIKKYTPKKKELITV